MASNFSKLFRNFGFLRNIFPCNNPVNADDVPQQDELMTNRQRCNSDGYVWKRQLVFRAKLTMHTAFERPDNVDPAAVTSLAISDDNEKGRYSTVSSIYRVRILKSITGSPFSRHHRPVSKCPL